MTTFTVVENVWHQREGQQPHGVPLRFERRLANDESPSFREGLAGEEWKPLECGWVKGKAYLALKNLEGQFTQKVPTSEEKSEAAGRVIELSAGGESILVPPGEDCRFLVGDVSKWRVRCVTGAKYYLMLVQV